MSQFFLQKIVSNAGDVLGLGVELNFLMVAPALVRGAGSQKRCHG